MRKIASVLMAGVIALGIPVATAGPANAHVSRCETSIDVPWRIGQTNRIVASTTTKRPIDGHQRRCGVTATIQVWAPSARGGGAWRNLGTADADWTSTVRRASATPSSSLLFGENWYRVSAEFWADGNQGTREHIRKSVPRKFNRYLPRR